MAIDYLSDPVQPSGNDSWAQSMAAEVKALIQRQAAGSARTLQRHLGPSELGAACDRQVVWKMVGLAPTGPTQDLWPSIVGTAVHAWLADAFKADNPQRWSTEMRVTPLTAHPGTADLYDHETKAVLDHKVFGGYSLGKLRQNGPSLVYRTQLELYALGCLREGLPVEHIGLIGYPREDSKIDGLYVWHQEMDTSVAEHLAKVKEDVRRRTAMAESVSAGLTSATEIPVVPGEDCHFCPFQSQCPYRV